MTFEELYNNTKERLFEYQVKYDKLQSNWNSLREWLEDYSDEENARIILDKMNELEGKDKECF